MSGTRNLRIAKYVFAISSAILLGACSDSGSSSRPSESVVAPSESQTPSATQPQETTRLSGDVVLGQIENALVDVYTVVDGAVDTTPIASTTTDANGEFQVDIENDGTSESLLVKVSGQSDSSTHMVCPVEHCGTTETLNGVDSNNDGVIGFDETIYLSDSFELSTVIGHFTNTDTYEFDITPLTHVAVTRAQAMGDVSFVSVETRMGELASLFDLPTTLSQMLSADLLAFDDLLANDDIALESDAFFYGVYTGVFADYAYQHNITIESSIALISEQLYTDSGQFNRALVLSLLDSALTLASFIASQDTQLQQLIANIQLLIIQYQCNEDLLTGDVCENIEPPIVVPPPEDELAVVKDFVSDFRSWARDFSLSAEPAVNNFKDRLDLVEGVWEDDLNELSQGLNDLLPGIAQVVSPYASYCYYCADIEQPIYISPDHKQLFWDGLEYNLYEDGTLTIYGTRDGIETDLDIQLPTLSNYTDSHVIEIEQGRVTNEETGTTLILSEGSQIVADYGFSNTFKYLAKTISYPYYTSPTPEALHLDAVFYLQAEYAIVRNSPLTFEPDATSPIDLSGTWYTTNDRAASGDYSLRSRHIGHNGSSAVSTVINTVGGYLSFDYLVSSESRYDYLNLYIDGNRVWRLSGLYSTFNTKSVYLQPGEHTITWSYTKDGSVDRGLDAAWIDNIQFPSLVDDGDLPNALETRTILNGNLSLSVEKQNGSWGSANLQGYLPGELAINATLNNDFDTDTAGSFNDQVTINLAATIANAADFIPPEALDYGTFATLGNYRFEENQFIVELPNQRITVEPIDNYYFLKTTYYSDGTVSSNYYQSNGKPLEDAVGDIVTNSAIGYNIIVPEEGLYKTTLLGSSPWGYYYGENRFDKNGGDILGFLSRTFEPTETAEQFLEISAALEITADIEGLETTTIGTTINRHDLNTGTASFYLEFEGRRFNVDTNLWYTPVLYQQDAEFSMDSPYLRMENQAGVVLELQSDETIDTDDVADSIVGDLIYNGTVYGTVERVKGLTIIYYIDGSAESIE